MIDEKESTKKLIRRYLNDTKVMQLATVGDNKPWISNVHFISDDEGNLYWLSREKRRHSKEINANPNIAVSIVIKGDMPVIGIQASGIAEKVTDIKTKKNVILNYVKKHGTGKEFYKRALAGINSHKLYCMRPEFYSLFDEVNFPKDSPKEWVL